MKHAPFVLCRFELRLVKGGGVIMAGITSLTGPEAFCKLPHKERLVVGQTYVFEVFGGAGTEPNACEFTINPDEVRIAVRLQRVSFRL